MGLLILCGLAGCDNRISLDEFIELQKSNASRATHQPTTRPAPAVQVDKQLGPYRVGPGDVLEVNVIGAGQVESAAAVRARVYRDGTIELPLAGSIKVAGMDLEQVEKAIQKQYEAKVYKEAVIHAEVVEPETTDVLVTGAVAAPGLVRLRRTQRNLLYAIVGAGGVSTEASGKVTLQRVRKPGEKVTANLLDPQGLRKALAMAPLENGDIIKVEAAQPNTIFVGGLVNVPSPQTYPPGTRVTVLQALAAAAGLRTDVLPREATLIRRMPDGKDVQVKLDLDKLQRGEAPNITLAAGDILWVPHTLETRIQEWISRNIYVRGGMNAEINYNFIHTQDIYRGKKGGTGTSLLIGGGGVP
ncbi:MAG: polysaccharide export protein [Planctomycetes bacterium]|nr:polysaccharide export protein [Planctomycetota bacterium]